MTSEILQKSEHSSRRSDGGDGGRPKTANIKKDEQLAKGDIIKMANNKNTKKNAKWISSYNHSQINDQSKIDNRSTNNVAINLDESGMGDAYVDNSKFKTPNTNKNSK